MLYIFYAVIILLIAYFLLSQKTTINSIKRNGIKTVGTIIENSEKQGSSYQLGGNINNPTVRFITNEGKEIIGNPVVGFISQKEVVVPSTINIVYDSKNPNKFYLDIG